MKSIGSISYGIAALGFLVLTVLLATNWRGRRRAGTSLSAVRLTAAWAAAARGEQVACRMYLIRSAAQLGAGCSRLRPLPWPLRRAR